MIAKKIYSKKFKKVIDEFVFYAIMLDSAKIPRQVVLGHNTQLEGG